MTTEFDDRHAWYKRKLGLQAQRIAFVRTGIAHQAAMCRRLTNSTTWRSLRRLAQADWFAKQQGLQCDDFAPQVRIACAGRLNLRLACCWMSEGVTEGRSKCVSAKREAQNVTIITQQ